MNRSFAQVSFAQVVARCVACVMLTLVIGCSRGGSGDAQPTDVVSAEAELDLDVSLADDPLRLSINEPIADSDLASRITRDDIETLIVDAGEITDCGIIQIASLESLIHLRLRLSSITDVGMEQLVACKSLRFLNLPHAKCTNRGIELLAALPDLESVRIGSSELDAGAATAIASIKTLRSVHLIDVPVDDAGLKQIATLPKLESLYLDGSNVTDDGWAWLFQHHRGLHVHVDQAHHDRDPSSDPH